MNTRGLGQQRKGRKREGWESAKMRQGLEQKGTHPQAPGSALIRIAVHARVRASPPGPPTAADGPAEGYFACANPSAAVPVAYRPSSGARGPVFSHLSPALSGPAFAPLSATGLGF
jgi:hypothetical protein